MALSLDTLPRAARVHAGARRLSRRGERPLSRRREAPLPRLALVGILVLAAGLLLWELPDNGWGNAYYADAVRAATHSWSAFWTGSLDLSQTVSVDKTPLAIWMMALSARVFGFSPGALLVPNALCALGSVALLNAMVKRAFGTAVGLLAALFLAVTPAIVAVGRFDNPDALLVLLLLAGAFAATRALESGRTSHAVMCGVCIGLAFNTKMLQAYLVLPAFLAAWMVVGHGGDRRRQARQLAAAGAAMIAVSLVWIGALSLLPASARPWVGDTTTNSWWQLVVGANGVGRISTNVLGAAGGGTSPAPLRLLNAPTGGQIAWLLPLALAGAVVGARVLRRRQRNRQTRAALALWIGWGAVHAVVFSLLGLFHPYYTSALAPAVATLAAFGACELWRGRRRSLPAASWAAGVLIVSVALAVTLLARVPRFLPWLEPITIGLALAGTALAIVRPHRRARWLRIGAAAALLGAVLAAPVAYSWATTQRQLGGIDPLAGPGRHEEPAWASDDSLARARLIRWLVAHQDGARYLAAVDGSLVGAPIALLSGRSVLIMGGFAGSDPAPSVSHLARLVSGGQVKTVVLSGTPSSANGASSRGLGGASVRARWVRRHCLRAALAPVVPAPNGQLTTQVYRCERK